MEPNYPPPMPDGQYRYGTMPPPPPPPSGPGIGANLLQSCLIAGCVTVFVPVLLVTGFFVMMGMLMSSAMDETPGRSAFPSIMQQTSVPGNNLRQRLLRRGSGPGSIAVISVHGTIDGGGSPLEGDGALSFVSDQLRHAGESDDVLAVILQIDSPGGGLTASDQLHHEVKRLREKGKPVIAWAGNLMASGGYYIAVAADGIMASPTSTVGSIGVILQHFQIRDLLDKIGVKVSPITSGEHKDIGSPFREMSPEERQLLQDYIDISHRRFVEVVAEGRKMDAEAVRGLATGGIYDAATAREKGLVDRIGYIEDAVAWAEEQAGFEDLRVVGYRRVFTFSDIFAEAGNGAAKAVLEAAGGGDDAPRAMAIWDGK